ncbi:MAG TPA: BtpA/SgcQ family protein, partial [Acidobacteriota bacterium]|nr:BtpA/SgcQ family protein [Acidobacteriota bacterium]
MLNQLFPIKKPVIAMIHVGALPGTPASHQSVDELAREALREAQVLCDLGFDGLMIENMHDTPYLKGTVGPEIVAAMTVIASRIKSEISLPLGIQILAGANLEALAVAQAASLEFIRVEGFTFAHVADEGLIESSAAQLLRYRRMIGAGRIQIWADIKKKHSAHAITADVSIGETAEAAEFMRADAVIVTGTATGHPPNPADFAEVKQHCTLPVILGSGVTPENVEIFYSHADALIVGSTLKHNGKWNHPIDSNRAAVFMEKVYRQRE